MAIESAEMAEEVVEESPATDAAETSHIPASLLGGKKAAPGDVIRLEVVNFDEDGGFYEVKYAMPKESKSSAIEEASMAFNPMSKMKEAM
jgi:hypothetical protein